MSIADLKLFAELFGLFSGNYDGLDGSMIEGYPNLLNYHSKVANEPRILAHYAEVSSDDLSVDVSSGCFQLEFNGILKCAILIVHLRRLRRSLGLLPFAPLKDLR